MGGPRAKQLREPTGTAGQVPVLQANKYFATGDLTPGGVAAQFSPDLTENIDGVTAPTVTTVGDFSALSHPDGSTTGQRFLFTVPDSYIAGDLSLRIVYSMSTSVASQAVRLETQVDQIDISAGTSATLLSATPQTKTVPDNTAIVRQEILTVAEGTFAAGDVLQFFVKRLGADGADTHTGAWQVFNYEVLYYRSGGAALGSIQFLAGPNFKVISDPGVSADADDDLALASDFESWALVTSTVASGRADVQWSGRLGAAQVAITSIKVPIKGTGQYQLKVYAEGQGATAVYDSGLTVAPASRTLLSLTSGNLSSQPTGEKRYHVVVEVTVDNGEAVYVGRPHTVQE